MEMTSNHDVVQNKKVRLVSISTVQSDCLPFLFLISQSTQLKSSMYFFGSWQLIWMDSSVLNLLLLLCKKWNIIANGRFYPSRNVDGCLICLLTFFPIASSTISLYVMRSDYSHCDLQSHPCKELSNGQYWMFYAEYNWEEGIGHLLVCVCVCVCVWLARINPSNNQVDLRPFCCLGY